MVSLPSHQVFFDPDARDLDTCTQMLSHSSESRVLPGGHHVPVARENDCHSCTLNVGGTVCIFSKSADTWVDAEIIGFRDHDFVCVKYTLGDDVCSKWLYVHSEHLFAQAQSSHSKIESQTTQVVPLDQHVHIDVQRNMHLEAHDPMQHCFHGSRDGLPLECNSDPANYYVNMEYIWHLLEEGSVVLISGKWLMEYGKDVPCAPLPSRRDLPLEAIVDVDQVRAVEQRLQQRRDQVNYIWELADIPKSIVAISHCWLTEDHPDPDGVLLRTLTPIIDAYMKSMSMYGGEFEGAFFFAWCSLFQPCHVKNGDGHYVRQRTPHLTREQTALHQQALENMDIWYTHQQTEVWMLTQSFSGQELAYNDRGWPTWERTVAHMISDSHAVLDLGKLDNSMPVLAMADVRRICAVGRKLPTLPVDFNDIIQGKHFTRGCQDKDRIQRNYTRNFKHAIACTTKIDYPERRLGDDAIIMLCREIMPICNNIQDISLSKNSISAVGACALGKSLPHLHLRYLSLPWNCIGADGVRGLAKLICQCNNLCRLDLGGNHLADDGAFALASCLGQCSSLEILFLNWNYIGSAGARALAPPLSQCQRLQGLSFKDNLAGDTGSGALARALRMCCNLEWLSLGNNGISDDGAMLIAEECSHLALLALGGNLVSKRVKQQLKEFLPHCSVKV